MGLLAVIDPAAVTSIVVGIFGIAGVVGGAIGVSTRASVRALREDIRFEQEQRDREKELAAAERDAYSRELADERRRCDDRVASVSRSRSESVGARARRPRPLASPCPNGIPGRLRCG